MSATISKSLTKYLSQIETQSSKVRLDGYFPVNTVIEAYEKGEKSGTEKVWEELKNKFVRASTQMFLYGGDVIKLLEEKKYEVSGFLVNPFSFKFMITTKVENTYNEEFIDDFYKIAGEFETKFKSEFSQSMRIMFIQDQNLNLDELQIDGFLKVSNGD